MPTCPCGANAEYVGLNQVENCSNPDCEWYGSSKALAPTEPPAADDRFNRLSKKFRDAGLPSAAFSDLVEQLHDAGYDVASSGDGYSETECEFVDPEANTKWGDPNHEAEVVASFARKFLESEDVAFFPIKEREGPGQFYWKKPDGSHKKQIQARVEAQVRSPEYIPVEDIKNAGDESIVSKAYEKLLREQQEALISSLGVPPQYLGAVTHAELRCPNCAHQINVHMKSDPFTFSCDECQEQFEATKMDGGYSMKWIRQVPFFHPQIYKV